MSFEKTLKLLAEATAAVKELQKNYDSPAVSAFLSAMGVGKLKRKTASLAPRRAAKAGAVPNGQLVKLFADVLAKAKAAGVKNTLGLKTALGVSPGLAKEIWGGEVVTTPRSKSLAKLEAYAGYQLAKVEGDGASVMPEGGGFGPVTFAKGKEKKRKA